MHLLVIPDLFQNRIRNRDRKEVNEIHYRIKHTVFCSLMFCLSAILLLTGCSSQAATSAANTSNTDNSKPYTFVWMTDTQKYTASNPDIFYSMTDWIVDNKDRENIKMVIHTGDITDDVSDKKQWKVAEKAIFKLDGVVPYSLLSGNHDVSWNLPASDYTNFLSYFGKDRIDEDQAEIIWYKDGKSRAQLLNVGDTKYIILALGWDTGSGTISWADKILTQYQDRIAILTTHDYMNADGSLSDNGNTLYSALVKPHTNVHLVLCGHNHNAARNIAEIDDNGDGTTDRTVYQLIADYQAEENGGNGFMRLLSIDEKNKVINVKTYSPYTKTWNCFDKDADEFTIPIDDWFSGTSQ